ncbi:MAG: LptF/LptG family permease [Candidatus Adiutrix sp.]|jgi:lipopolysaccharide export LptBFGC system permease protein LptF|nr:LptF/LptG family permease [Candidatus Adiutrix sp.]
MAGRFLRAWVLLLVGFALLYLAIDFMEKLNSFTNAKMGPGRILLFFAAQLPKIFGLMAPVAALVIYLLYYVISSLGWSLGMMGSLSPAASVWGANILLSALGLFLLKRVNRHVPVDPAEFMRRLLARRARPRNP